MTYADFLARKALLDVPTGMEKLPKLSAHLFGYQADIVRWALRRGRAALFAGTGLGKTLMELAWADAVARFTGKPVLIFTPLAVAPQFVAEAERFGLRCERAASKADCKRGVYVTNYDKLHLFDMARGKGFAS